MIGYSLSSLAVMILCMSVSEAKVLLAGVADNWHQLSFLTFRLAAAVGEDSLLGLVRPAVLVNVGRDGQVGEGAAGSRHGTVAQGTDGDLDVLFMF